MAMLVLQAAVSGTIDAAPAISEVAAHLETIAGLLGWLVVLAGIVTLALLATAGFAGYTLFSTRQHRAGDLFRLQAEDLLGRGEIEEVIRMARVRLERYPDDVWAHWYLGQGYFRRQAWPDARHAFRSVLELEPSWYGSVEDYLARIEEGLVESAPRLVD